eukprot:CAMPEP_0184647374 /NCGR_PEP_ID=MMETSP0308-20130426/4284_1 /TAXON_ID=38269 /ORGANISM="Gloeochaete witrockiana, Strain SAG 46.84" /LENGTH=329 /DNA_ID=CAMNT_0027078265 /DNA_START=113 /DNA_END=1102 /DNA_ORIENTATION=-
MGKASLPSNQSERVTNGFSGFVRWADRVHLLEKAMLVAMVHVNESHWVSIVIVQGGQPGTESPREAAVLYMDSLRTGKVNETALKKGVWLATYLAKYVDLKEQAHHRAPTTWHMPKTFPADPQRYSHMDVADVATQDDMASCGHYAVRNAKAVVQKLELGLSRPTPLNPRYYVVNKGDTLQKALKTALVSSHLHTLEDFPATADQMVGEHLDLLQPYWVKEDSAVAGYAPNSTDRLCNSNWVCDPRKYHRSALTPVGGRRPKTTKPPQFNSTQIPDTQVISDGESVSATSTPIISRSYGKRRPDRDETQDDRTQPGPWSDTLASSSGEV